MADWATISSLATAGGTLVLAIATFGSIRSANRAARVAERSLLAQQRPILIPSREDDLTERVRFGDGFAFELRGHGSTLAAENGVVYLAIGLRNGGAGLAVLHGWRAQAWHGGGGDTRPDLDGFRRLTRDLYIPASSNGFWMGTIRDTADPDYDWICERIERGDRISIDLLYGDQEGGQRTIARFAASSDHAEGADSGRAEVIRYWNVDGSDPR